jgi:ABC-type phosphate transport system substrate-binding protein
MRFRSLGLIVAALIVAACGSSTAPGKAGDPSLLFTNNTDSWVFVTWRDGITIAGADSVAPRTQSQCVRFLAQPDSAYWAIKVNTVDGSAEQTAPYFNPADRPAWRVIVSTDRSGASILTTLVDTAC